MSNKLLMNNIGGTEPPILTYSTAITFTTNEDAPLKETMPTASPYNELVYCKVGDNIIDKAMIDTTQLLASTDCILGYNETLNRFSFSDKNKLLSCKVESIGKTKITNMNYMFSDCRSLTTLDLSSFDTSNVTSVGSMFNTCNSLTTLDLSNFDTSKITDMNYMFTNCLSLTTLDLSNFDTSNVTNMSGMFYNCTKLNSLDLRNFDTSNVTKINNMLRSVPQNCKVYVGSRWTLTEWETGFYGYFTHV